MKNKIISSPKLKFIYKSFLTYLLFFTLFRIFFLVFFKNELNNSTVTLLPKVFLLGFRFDLRLTAFLLLPSLLLINLPTRESLKEKILNILNSTLFFTVSFLYILDAGYFAYLKSRLNSTVIAFLKNPIISFQMVRESYPWPLFVVTLIVITTVMYFLFKKKITPDLFSHQISKKKDRYIGNFIFFMVLTLSIYGSFKRYPLRWSEAFISPDPFTANLSLNPILYLFDTYSFQKFDYDLEEARKAYPTIAPLLGIEIGSSQYDEKNLNFIRNFSEDVEKRKNKPNIVVIIMESMGYYKTGIGGSKVNPTPNLDALASESLLFTKFYTPTVATARSVFAAITSLPDISKVETGSRNPFVVNQHTNIGELVDHEKFYFLGGSANWGNIRGVLSYNIPGLHIFEEGSYKSPKVDVWGISDLNLFKEAIENLNQRNSTKPFFTLIQTSGFHRPYTIPTDSDDFKVLTNKDIDEKEVLSYGFESMNEYNAMRLQDYSLGKFIELSKKQAWYDNTIFFVFGDHSLPHNNAKNVKEWEKTQSNGYHVPLIIHSKKYIKAGIEEKIASEMDVMPTVAGLVGIPYKTRSFGKDLFNSKLDKNRMAFSYNWYAPFHLSLIDKDFYFEYIPYNQKGLLVKHSEKNPNLEDKEKYPEVYKSMEIKAKAFYETAKYLLHHNQHMY